MALDAEHKASAISDGTIPEMKATHLDPMLTRLRDSNYGRRQVGQRVRFPENSIYHVEPEQVEFPDDTTAKYTNCTYDDGVIYEVATGRIVDGDVGTVRFSVTFRNLAGMWMLAERDIDGTWNGVAQCDG